MGAFAMPTATCSHGALLQHAASTCFRCDLLRPAVGRAASKLEMARRVHRLKHRTSLYALPSWASSLWRSEHNVFISEAVQISRSPDSVAGPSIFAMGAYPRVSAASLELDRHSSHLRGRILHI